MLTIIEVIAILITAIIILYIAYCCCIKINARRKEEKERSREKRRNFIMREMESRMGPAESKANLAIECDREHLHFPRNHNIENTFPRNHNTENIEKETSNKSTQDTITFA